MPPVGKFGRGFGGGMSSLPVNNLFPKTEDLKTLLFELLPYPPMST